MSKVTPINEPWRIYLKQGISAVQKGHYDHAVDAFEKAFAVAPDSLEVLLALGRERMRQGLFAEADTLLRKALKLDPTNATIAATLARLIGLHCSREKEAFQIIHKALKHNPDASPLHVIRGELLLNDGIILDARAAFGRVLDQDITDEAARCGMARTYNAEGIQLSELGEYEPAIFSFKRASALDPNWAGPYVNLGVTFGRMGNLNKAIEAYTDALERAPSNTVALFNLGTAYKEMGNYHEAINIFEELLNLAPDFPNVRSALANTLAEIQNFDQAIALFLEELEFDSDSAETWSNLGLAYLCAGNIDRGEECLQQALTLDKNYLNAYFNLAAFYITQNRIAEAQQLLHNAFRINPQKTVELFSSDARFDLLRKTTNFEFLHKE